MIASLLLYYTLIKIKFKTSKLAEHSNVIFPCQEIKVGGYGLNSKFRTTMPDPPKGPRNWPLSLTSTPPAFPSVKRNRSRARHRTISPACNKASSGLFSSERTTTQVISTVRSSRTNGPSSDSVVGERIGAGSGGDKEDAGAPSSTGDAAGISAISVFGAVSVFATEASTCRSIEEGGRSSATSFALPGLSRFR